MLSLDSQLAALLARCSHDEKRVMLVQLQRLDRWRAKYGPLVLAGDARDFMREMAEESVDHAFYAAALYLQEQDSQTADSPAPPASAASVGPAGGEAGPRICTHADSYGSAVDYGVCLLCGRHTGRIDAPAITRTPAVELGEEE